MRKDAPEEADVSADDRDQPKQVPGTWIACYPSIARRQQGDCPRNHLPYEQGREESDPQRNALPFQWYWIGFSSCVHDISLYLSVPIVDSCHPFQAITPVLISSSTAPSNSVAKVAAAAAKRKPSGKAM